jgi:peptidoglycan/LPS O-acetylase OafA/YrhL
MDIFSSIPDQWIRVNLFFFSGVLLYFLKTKRKSIQIIFFFIFSFFALVLTAGNHAANSYVAIPSLQIYQYRDCTLFATIIVFLLWSEPRVSTSISILFVQLGNLSYGIYLLHIPVQLVILLTVPLFGGDPAQMAENSLFLLSFLLVTLVLSRLVFQKFEEPSRKRIRSFAPSTR